MERPEIVPSGVSRLAPAAAAAEGPPEALPRVGAGVLAADPRFRGGQSPVPRVEWPWAL